MHAITDTEWKLATRVINPNKGTAHGDDQQAIKVTDGGTSPDGIAQGQSMTTMDPWVPNHQVYCRVYVATIKKGTQVNKTGGISDTAATIPVVDTTAYASSGTIIIENEQITYKGKTANSFTGCVRGANLTTKAEHANGVKVNFYVSEEEFIKRVFAHEAGHMVGLKDKPLTSKNIMSEPGERGVVLGNGFWDTFIGNASSLTAAFVVKE